MSLNLESHSPSDPLVEDLLKVHQVYCDANLLMPENFIEIITEYSAPELTGFGTGKDEVVNSLQEYCLIALRAKEQIPEGIVYNYQNLNAKIIGEVGITDGVINFSFNIAGEKITLHPRLSVVYHFANDQWQAVHVHFSFPSSEQAEGEAFPIDALKAKNEELEKLVAEKTADLEQKNNELLVEVALEKVRSRTMAMQHSDELQFVLQEATNQLQQLGFKVHATNFSINLDIHDNPDMHLWVGAPGQQGYFKKVVIPYFHHPMFTRTYEAMDKGEELITDIFSREEKNRFYEYVYEHTDLKNVPEERKNYVLHAEGLARSTVIAKNSAITIMNFDATPYSKEENKIVKRIAHVFDQAYTRFLDLQQAEAQAREAQIEAGLERVRAQAMAMKSSDELKKVVKALFEELTRLDVKLAASMITTFNATTLDLSVWMFHPTTIEPFVNLIPYNQEPFYHEMVRAWNERSPNWLYCLAGDAKIKWNDFLFRETDFSRLPQPVIDEMQRPDDVFFAASYYNYGAIMAASLEPFPQQSIDLIQRFSKVFDLSYTRFLDLEKAEAQAREAQIETALEKVRSRSLAMHHSAELSEVITVVLQKLEELGIEMEKRSALILVYEEGVKDYTQWVASPGHQSSVSLKTPYFDNPIQTDKWKARKKGIDFYSKSYSLQEKNNLFEYFFEHTDLRSLPAHEKDWILSSENYQLTVALEKNSAVAIADFSGKSLAENENQILKRFAKVFEQTYIRFLDLQKAEAQAREAQIEVALERVRSRTMAMQKSEELSETATVLFRQFKELGEAPGQVSIGIVNEKEQVIDMWVSMMDNPKNPSVKVPIQEPIVVQKIYNGWKEQKKSLIIDLSGNELKEYVHFRRSLGTLQIDNDLLYGRRVTNVAFFSKGIIALSAPEPRPAETIKLLERFAGVFDLTYTRFLDLQKAEAQAREAQIESALEKVRSRSLAMHSSNELSDVVQIVFEKLQELNFHMEDGATCILIFNEGSKDHVQWVADPGQTYAASFDIPYTDDSISQDLTRARENGMNFFSKLYPVEEKNDHFTYLFEHTDYSRLPHAVKELILGSEHYGFSIAYAKITAICIPTTSGRLVSGDGKEILKRFANVFDQAYTRFVDLQKAEAQAREAQIEAALERVRSKTMAMHSSRDVADSVATLFEEVAKLGIETLRCGIGIILQTKVMEVWTAKQGANGADLIIGHLDMTTHALLRGVLNTWINKEHHFSYDLKGDDLVNYFTALNNDPEYPIRFEIASLPSMQFHNSFFFPEGVLFVFSKSQLPAETLQIFKRFASVFGQTYRRYLDLQKAEAQAREAQVEAALERVRSRAMAMHKSDDLNLVVATIFEQLRTLNLGVLRCGIGIFNKERRTGDVWSTSMSDEESTVQISGDESFDIHPLLQGTFDAWLEQTDFYYVLENEDLKNYYNEISKTNFNLPELSDSKLSEPQKTQYYYTPTFKAGNLYAFRETPFTEEDKYVLNRFAAVVNLTYNRFLDLQKAEAQAREAQIEVALERVRSRTMAMHKSEELSDTSFVLFQQLKELGVVGEQISIGIFNEAERIMDLYATIYGNQWKDSARVQFEKHEVHRKTYAAWKEQKKSLVLDLSGEALDDYNRFKMEETPTQYKSKEGLPKGRWVIHIAFFSKGGLFFSTNQPHPKETIQLLERFASVFDLTYTRFLDLQKAEAQAREAQIEAALERVRSSAMAMHKSDDLHDAVTIMFEQFQKLNLDVLRCGVGILNNDSRTGTVWATSVSDNDLAVQISANESFDTHPLMILIYDYWQKQEDLSYVLQGQDLISYYNAMEASGLKLPKSQLLHPEDQLQPQYYYAAMFNAGGLYAFMDKPFSPEDRKIMKRFASVVNLTYNRFLDLQKAEAQAREAKIEAALERVRSKAMAMHKSDDLHAAVATVFEEFGKLNINVLRCGVGIFDNDSRTGTVWTTSTTQEGTGIQIFARERFDTHPLMIAAYDAWKNQQDFSYILEGEDLIAFYKAMDESELKLPGSQLIYSENQLKTQYKYAVMFEMGALYAFRDMPFTEEDIRIMKRFASVFDLTYKRFLDLRKAESQAREATVEAALERVRTQTMAMHSSHDVGNTAIAMFKELENLGIVTDRTGVLIFDEMEHMEVWNAAADTNKIVKLVGIGRINVKAHTMLQQAYNAWKNGDSNFTYTLSGKDLLNYYTVLKNEPEYPFDIPEALPARQTSSVFYFPEGGVYTFSTDPLTLEAMHILTKFAGVFALTYKRFLDLQKAEANAKEAVRQATVDRIRAEIASMRTPGDLEKITPLIWNELTILGVPFIRCGVFIMDDVQQLIHTYLSTPDGKAIAAFHLAFNTPGNISEVLLHWKSKKIYIDYWDEVAYTEFAGNLVKQGVISTPEQYLNTLPAGGFYLHFLPFLQGMLYVGNTTQLGEEEIKLIQSIADAFSTAYARYEDFNKLEAAKQQVDNALQVLKQTQQQLIQSEKMASLGELTAGIAHEIQNPLNFINNFSEVNTEMIEELKEQLAKANGHPDSYRDAMIIAEDIKENETKINHHGKRADAIVKGMLQHSRKSSDKKEPTELNALADEYLRLSYHGLRAKDKTFNAAIETVFDKDIGSIEIIPQDIGRVLLNLLNNAFYAVNEKNKKLNGTFKPLVYLSTKRAGNTIEISVKDNGIGMPEGLLNKIFQPFFTTKPTGQGTGLGLSLSYDIIKAHGGEMKVETKEGEGTSFRVVLPINSK